MAIKTCTCIKDEPLYTVVNASVTVQKTRVQNIDHSSFPILCDVTYRKMQGIDPRLPRSVPYCSFLHYCNTLLQCQLLDTIKNVNLEPRFADEVAPRELIMEETLVPRPIAEYLSCINTSITPSGDTVYINLPDATIPKEDTPAAGNVPALPAGTFGVCNAANHISYECNISPYVTMMNVRNAANQQQNPPLPGGLFPEGGLPNANLLGYMPTHDISPDARAALVRYTFADGKGTAARVRYSRELIQDNAEAVRRLADRLDMVDFLSIKRATTISPCIYLDYNRIVTQGDANSANLPEQPPIVCASFEFASNSATQATYFRFKKKRSPDVRGLCYTVAGAAPPLWGESINRNFNMEEAYAPTFGSDLISLRSSENEAIPPGPPKCDVCYECDLGIVLYETDDRISDGNRRQEIEMDSKADKTALRVFNKRKVYGLRKQFTIAGARGVARPKLRNRIPGKIGLDVLHTLLRLYTSPEAEQIIAFFQRVVSSVMQAHIEKREHRETRRTNDNNHQHLTWDAAAEVFGHREWASWEQEAVHNRGAWWLQGLFETEEDSQKCLNYTYAHCSQCGNPALLWRDCLPYYEDTHERDPRLVRCHTAAHITSQTRRKKTRKRRSANQDKDTMLGFQPDIALVHDHGQMHLDLFFLGKPNEYDLEREMSCWSMENCVRCGNSAPIFRDCLMCFDLAPRRDAKELADLTQEETVQRLREDKQAQEQHLQFLQMQVEVTQARQREVRHKLEQQLGAVRANSGAPRRSQHKHPHIGTSTRDMNRASESESSSVMQQLAALQGAVARIEAQSSSSSQVSDRA
ncbi:hypothetical protein QAD02_018014 [Eretmocerus hayati]|uniref:Uncharacterized protein n=1 Tax=Eretmocerus hayati TaxID=131215 RepID=A0ACC2PFU6_9HYME|nr:hypothetical protein QAD02_018014 [Eretmocerus hayati]